MLKKYLPLITLVVVAALFFWIKSNQRDKNLPTRVTTDEPAPAPDADPFNRNTARIKYSKHALCRMECRKIDESEVREILQKGAVNYEKIEEGPKGKTYPLEGVTHDRQRVRIVFAPHQNELVVVTAIDLDREWPCDCN